MLPEVYLHQEEILSKTRATSLPPHHPYYCAIDLLPRTPPPKGQLYSLSGLKRKTMDKYIHGAHSGIICPSSSLAGPIWPCIDYHGLKSIMVKNCNHLPLISLGCDLLKGPQCGLPVCVLPPPLLITQNATGASPPPDCPTEGTDR